MSPVARLRAFTDVHDDLPAFHAAYLVLTVLIAALFNLGVFAMLIVAHMAMDWGKERLRGRSPMRSLAAVLKESIIDVTLLTAALTAAVYFHHWGEFVAASGILRAQGTIILGLGLLLPKLKILTHLSHVFEEESAGRRKLTGIEKFCLVALPIFVILLVLAPFISKDPARVMNMLHEQLTPWNV
jgi:hypothetical protein